MVRELSIGQVSTGLFFIEDDVSSKKIREIGQPINAQSIDLSLIKSQGKLLVAVLEPEFPRLETFDVAVVTDDWGRRIFLDDPSYSYTALGYVGIDYFLIPAEAVSDFFSQN